MNKIFTLIGLFFLATSVNGQDIEINLPDETDDVSGTEIELLAGGAEMHQEFEVKNTSGGPLTLRIERIKLAELPGTKDYICWGSNSMDGNCYPASDVSVANPYVTPDAATFEDGEHGWLVVYHQAEGIPGCAGYRYFIIDEDDNQLDSVDVEFCSAVNVEKEDKLILSVFPNPAAELINIEISNALQLNASFQLYNIVGEVVVSKKVTEGLNKVAISNLPNGVYFYSILSNQNILETKKIVIRH